MLRCRVPSRARARPTVRPTARRYTTAPARDAAAAAASPSTTPQLFDAEYFQKRRRDLEMYAQRFGVRLYPPNRGGIVPLSEYRTRFHDVANGTTKEEVVSVVGRITAKREASSRLIFYDIQGDDSYLQVMATQKRYHNADHFAAINEILKRGDIVRVEGFPSRAKLGELSITPERMELLTPCLHHLPEAGTLRNPVRVLSLLFIGRPSKGKELRQRWRCVDLVTNGSTRAPFLVRAKVRSLPRIEVTQVRGVQVISYIRAFLNARRFVEVETPTLWPTVGGANARPFVAHSNALSSDLFLRIAPELFLKQLVIGGFDRVYEIGKQFRNEGVDATHNPEFTTCEFYEAHSDMYKLLTTTEEMLRGIVSEVTNGKQEIVVKVGGNDVTLNFANPFPRIPVLPALEDALKVKLPDVNSYDSVPRLLEIIHDAKLTPKKPFTPAKLLDFLISELLEPQCIQPTFLTEHPLVLSPLAKVHRSKSQVTERFELLIAGKEICNAYSELNDPREQFRRFEQQQQEKNHGDDEAQVPDEEFCRALEIGLPPTGGWGMGIDRLVMLLTNRSHIRDVLFFPVLKAAHKGGDETASQDTVQEAAKDATQATAQAAEGKI